MSRNPGSLGLVALLALSCGPSVQFRGGALNTSRTAAIKASDDGTAATPDAQTPPSTEPTGGLPGDQNALPEPRDQETPPTAEPTATPDIIEPPVVPEPTEEPTVVPPPIVPEPTVEPTSLPPSPTPLPPSPTPPPPRPTPVETDTSHADTDEPNVPTEPPMPVDITFQQERGNAGYTNCVKASVNGSAPVDLGCNKDGDLSRTVQVLAQPAPFRNEIRFLFFTNGKLTRTTELLSDFEFFCVEEAGSNSVVIGYEDLPASEADWDMNDYFVKISAPANLIYSVENWDGGTCIHPRR